MKDNERRQFVVLTPQRTVGGGVISAVLKSLFND